MNFFNGLKNSLIVSAALWILIFAVVYIIVR